MTPAPLSLALRGPALLIAAATAVVALRTALAWDEMYWRFLFGDDNMLRLINIRDWLGGQGWFDTVQHRMLPPGGVSIHWSRYVDAAIAAIIVPVSWVVPMYLAEEVALAVWPMLLLVLLIGVTARGTWRLAGPVAAVGAVACLLSWYKISAYEFRPTRIDHHNVQILLGTMVVMAAVLPGASLRRGCLAGAAAAASLAVGIEMIPALAVIWVWLALRYAWGLPGAAGMLAGYAGAVAGLSPLLMIGQTPVAEWFDLNCDELGPPALLLACVGAAASLAPMLLWRVVRPRVLVGARVAVMAGVALAGLWLAAPWIVGPCLDSPRSGMPPDLAEFITTRIPEGQPIWLFASYWPQTAVALMLPVVAGAVGGVMLWRGAVAEDRWRLGLAIGLALLGIVGSLGQTRAIIPATLSVPLLVGLSLAALLRWWRAGVWRSLAVAAGGLCLLFPLEAVGPLQGALRLAGIDGSLRPVTFPRDGTCRNRTALSEIALVRPGIVLTSQGLAVPMLLLLPHASATAPYHRAGADFTNGAYALESEAQMRAILRRTGADYVALCRTAEFGDRYAWGAALLAGQLPDWLVPAEGAVQDRMLILSVDKAALERAALP